MTTARLMPRQTVKYGTTLRSHRLKARCDLETDRAGSSAAQQPVDTFPVIIDNDMIKLEVN